MSYSKTNLTKIFITLATLALLFVNEDVFLFGVYEDSRFVTIRYAVQIALFLILLAMAVIQNKMSVDYRVIAVVLLILISMIVNFDFRAGYLFMIMILITAYLSIRVFGLDTVMDTLYRAMTFLCLYSVLLFAFGLVFPQFVMRLPILHNVNGVEFYFGGFSNLLVYSGGFPRNFGPFREPGVFQMFITISLLYGLFKKKNTSMFSRLIHIAALITTFSTTGYIALFLVIAALIANQAKSHDRGNRVVIVVSLITLLFLTLFTNLIYTEGYGSVFGKLFGTYRSISMIARRASVFVNLKMFASNPLTGKGLTYVEDNFPLLSVTMYGIFTNDNTNTLLIQLAQFGIIHFLFLVYGYFKFAFTYFKINTVSKLFVFACIICLCFGENMSYSYLFSLLFIAGFGGKKHESSADSQ